MFINKNIIHKHPKQGLLKKLIQAPEIQELEMVNQTETSDLTKKQLLEIQVLNQTNQEKRNLVIKDVNLWPMPKAYYNTFGVGFLVESLFSNKDIEKGNDN